MSVVRDGTSEQIGPVGDRVASNWMSGLTSTLSACRGEYHTDTVDL